MKKVLMLFLVIFINNTTAKNLTTSLIIPCHYKHVILLESLLHLYEEQTILPDEAIVSISEYNKSDNSIVENLNSTNWKFPIKILKFNEKLSPGKNRNAACEHANGDILVLNDADDIPHIQRIEIIKFFFEHYDIVHLMHQHTLYEKQNDYNSSKQAKMHNIDSIEVTWFKNIIKKSEVTNIIENLTFNKNAHNGNIAIAKDIFQKINWTNLTLAEDQMFNKTVYTTITGNKVFIAASLINYRPYLSSLH